MCHNPLLAEGILINRVLIAGLGSIGKRHLFLARELLPDADIRVLRHQATSQVPEYSNGCFSSISEAITFAPQIAVLANPAPFHIATARALANTGVHLLIEKPLSNSTKGIEQLIETCHKQRIVLLTGYNLRYLPSLQRFRDLLGERVVGKVLSFRCEIGQYLPSWRPDSDYRHGVSARHDLGGGALFELSHELDYLRWIFGEVEWVKATLSRQSGLEIDVEDSAHLTLGFVPVADGHRLIGTVNIDFIRHDTTRLCTVIGESGSLRWNGLTGVVEHFKAGAKKWHELFQHQQQPDDSYVGEWRHFLQCVNAKATPLVSGHDGLKVLQIIDAARLSSESGKKVLVTMNPILTKGSA
jgi:predicted dehydrogenase